MADARKVKNAVWQWIKELLCNESHPEQGLRDLRNSRERDLQAHRQRVAVFDDLLGQHKRKIERLTKAFGDEEDELIGASLQQEMRATKRAYDALQLEKERLESQITQR